MAFLLAVVVLINNGADAQARYYFSRNVMPTVVSYRQQQRYPVVNRNSYATAYNPYAAAAAAAPVNNWARPLVSVPQQSFQPQYISRPANNYYYGGSNSGENNSGESREVYRRFW